MAKGKKIKKRNVKVESEGLAFIHASFNNIIISLTNKAGQVISWGSAGKSGFRGSKKNTPICSSDGGEQCFSDCL
jgi:small subunit ribosomal protein S11